MNLANVEGIKLNTYNNGVQASNISRFFGFPKTAYLNGKAEKQDSFVSSYSVPRTKNPVAAGVNSILAAKAPRMFMKKYINERTIKNALETNPNIKQILLSKGMPVQFYLENVEGENQEHFIGTYEKAKTMSGELSAGERDVLLQSALLHDIGKAFIPPEILNKAGKLTPKEREIVDTHARLGAEILKTTTIDQRVVNAVGMHHSSSADPIKKQNIAADYLSVADVHDALQAKRPYKDPFPKEKIEHIMKNDPKLNQNIVNTVFAA